MELHQWRDIDCRGTVVRVDYTTPDHEGKPWAKYANVYLPYGYDGSKPYNILYLMHGGGGNPDAWLDCSQIKNALDRSFAEGRAQPMIVVFPTFYSLLPGEYRKNGVVGSWENEQVRFFQQEFGRDLLPAVEGRFRTYAENTTPEGLKASRLHRAFGGFSMGSATTWYVLLDHLDLVSVFLPLSGDCWGVKPTGGATASEETAKLLADCVKSHGYTAADLRIFAGTGTEDPACRGMVPQLAAMEAYPDCFLRDDADLTHGNLHFTLKEGAVHAYEEVYHHVWNYLPYLF